MATYPCMNTYTHIQLYIHWCICLFPYTAQLGSWEDEDELLQGLTKILSALFIKPATQNGHEIMSSVASAGTTDLHLSLQLQTQAFF